MRRFSLFEVLFLRRSDHSVEIFLLFIQNTEHALEKMIVLGAISLRCLQDLPALDSGEFKASKASDFPERCPKERAFNLSEKTQKRSQKNGTPKVCRFSKSCVFGVFNRKPSEVYFFRILKE